MTRKYIPLLARYRPRMTQVMLRRDQLRKAPRSEEWMLYGWLVAASAASVPHMTHGLSARSHTATYRTSDSIGRRWKARSHNWNRDPKSEMETDEGSRGQGNYRHRRDSWDRTRDRT